jgi:hypothetical protein
MGAVIGTVTTGTAIMAVAGIGMKITITGVATVAATVVARGDD